MAIHSQLEKNTEEFASLGAALKAAKGSSKEPIRSQIKALFAQRRPVVDSMRSKFNILHDHLNACRDHMTAFVNTNLQSKS
jgi:hypothetical protein